jgi:hypothetical protein
MPALNSFLHEVRAVDFVAAAARIILAQTQPEPADVTSLIETLRTIDLEADLVTAMRGEAAWGMATFEAATGEAEGRAARVLQRGTSGWHRYPMPAVYLSANRRVFMQEMARVIRICSRPWRGSTAIFAADERELPGYAQMASTMVPDPQVPMLRRDEGIAWQRMCLAALEISAQDGPPAALTDLRAPAEDTLVRDVFSGRHLRYAPTESGFTLYSVGRDLDDDGGIPQRHAAGQTGCDGDLVWSAGA